MDNIPLVSKETVTEYTMLYPILSSLFVEIKELSKKKQDGLLNEIKVRMTNRVLEKVKYILKDDPTNQFLDLLDNDNLPSNSDAVLIIAQYQGAMEQFRKRHQHYSKGTYYWNFGEDDDEDDAELFDDF